MKLICEVADDQALQFLEEADASGGKKLYIQGPFLQAEQPNKNHRQYRIETLQREVKRYNENYVQKNRAYGELGHPQGPTINLDRVSHMIVKLEQSGNDFIGKAKITDTPSGNIVKALMGEGASLGVSSRGMGSLKDIGSGLSEVQDDYYLATPADIVADPSAPDAFVQGIMENKEWTCVEGIWMEQHLDAAKKFINNTPAPELNAAKIKVFEAFIQSL